MFMFLNSFSIETTPLNFDKHVTCNKLLILKPKDLSYSSSFIVHLVIAFFSSRLSSIFTFENISYSGRVTL